MLYAHYDEPPPTVREPAASRSGTRPRMTVESAYQAAESTAAIASAIRIVLLIADGPVSSKVREALPDLGPVHELAMMESIRLYDEARQIDDAL